MEKYFDGKGIATIVVAFLVIILLIWGYRQFTGSKTDRITAAAYDALTPEQKAMYKADTENTGFYVHV